MFRRLHAFLTPEAFQQIARGCEAHPGSWVKRGSYPGRVADPAYPHAFRGPNSQKTTASRYGRSTFETRQVLACRQEWMERLVETMVGTKTTFGNRGLHCDLLGRSNKNP
jgi:hypothetical protein